MKVAIDKGPLIGGHKVRGVGVYTRELIKALKNEEKKNGELKIESFDFFSDDFESKIKGFDVAHFQSFHPYFISLPNLKNLKKMGVKTVVTIHDTIPLIYPKKYPPGVEGRIVFLKNKKLLKDVDAIIAVSETSKKDICRFYKVDPKKVYVGRLAPKGIYKKLSGDAWKKDIVEKYNLPNSFVLYVGDINFNKNIEMLIRVCQKRGINLVICGKQALEVDTRGLGLDVLGGPMDWIRFVFNIPHPENSHYEELSKLFEKNGYVKRLGFVPDEDLVKIFNLAKLYVQPSIYEGFGLPILEAIACETPVLASKINAHTEISGDAVEYFNPSDEKDLEKKLKKCLSLSVPPKKLDYSWEKTAKSTLDVYESVLGKK